MILDIQALNTITSWSVIITGSAFSLYVVVTGSLVERVQEKKSLDLMFTLEKHLKTLESES
jgi:hypothetical protein